jgi:hypothetical protein
VLSALFLHLALVMYEVCGSCKLWNKKVGHWKAGRQTWQIVLERPAGIEGLLLKAGKRRQYSDWPWEWLPEFKPA